MTLKLRLLIPLSIFSALVFLGCSKAPPAGRFCRQDKSGACWDINIPARTMSLVNVRGERLGKEFQLRPAEPPADYWTDGLNSKILIKVVDSNTIGLRNSENSDTIFDHFVRHEN